MVVQIDRRLLWFWSRFLETVEEGSADCGLDLYALDLEADVVDFDVLRDDQLIDKEHLVVKHFDLIK